MSRAWCRAAFVAAVVAMGATNAFGVELNIDFLTIMSEANGVKEAQDCNNPETFYTGGGTVQPRCVLKDWAHELISGGLLAVKHFNDRNGAYVPEFAQLNGCDKIITPRIFDTGISASLAVRALLEILKERKPDIVIGCQASAASIPTALITGILDVPQISYWSTSSQLDNKAQYSRFMRNIPTDEAVAFAICKYWISQDWKYANVIYVNDNYGEAYKEGVVKWCTRLGMEKVNVFPFLASDSGAIIEAQVAKAVNTEVNVFLLITVSRGSQQVLKAAHKLSALQKGKAWFLSDGVTNSELLWMLDNNGQVSEEFKDTWKSSSGFLRVIAAGGTQENARFQKFKSDYESMDWGFVNASLPSWWKLNSNWVDLIRDNALPTDMTDNVATYAYDAVATAGLIACNLVPQGPLPESFGSDFFARAHSDGFHFDGLTGLVQYDEIGNRAVETANYQMFQVVLTESYNSVSSSSERIGSFANNSWSFSKPVLFTGESAEPILDHPVAIVNWNRASGAVKGLCRALMYINYLFALTCIAWATVYRAHKVVRASQRVFLYLIPIGVFFSSGAISSFLRDDEDADFTDDALWNISLSPVPMRKYKPADVACNVGLLSYMIGFTLVYSSLACKIFRVKKIFANTSMKKVTITISQLFGVIVACLSVDLVIFCVMASGDDALHWSRKVISVDNFGTIISSVGQCTSKNLRPYAIAIAFFHLSLLLWGSVLSYQCRYISTAFSEGKYVSMAMFCYLQVLALAMPVMIIVADNPEANMFVRSCVLFLNDFTVLALIFIPKMTMVLSNSDQPFSSTSVLNTNVATVMPSTDNRFGGTETCDSLKGSSR